MSFLSLLFYHYKFGFILNIAFVLDIILGDPEYKLHPVRLIGKIISFFYKSLKTAHINKRFLGIIIVIVVLLCTILFYILTIYILGNYRIIFDIFLCYSFLALKDLYDHIKPIIKSIDKNDIEDARYYLGKVVGRDTNNLDRDAIIRACIETIAEGFVDGFLSPIFWFFIGAFFRYPVLFMLFYKVINTLDSMLGYKSPELKDLGFASARLDDIFNFIPARLSIGIFYLGACICGLNAKRGLYIAMRDRLKHESPNSAHPEAFIAGVTGIRLGGPMKYFYGFVNKPFIGDNKKKPEVFDIKLSLRLIWVSALIWICTISLLLFLV